MSQARAERPTWREVVFALGATVLTASQLMNFRGMETAQTAANYYRDERGVLALQYAATGVNVLVVGCVAVWVFTNAGRFLLPVIVGLAAAGFGLAWAELFVALRHAGGPLYELTGLPFRPVNNLGVIGATLFAGYLLMRIPDRRLRPGPSFLVKVAFVACTFLVQLAVWSALASRSGGVS